MKRLKMICFTTVITLSLVFIAVPVDAANPGDIVINEIMKDPYAASDYDGEWFELYNPTTGDIDINGWTIRDNDFDSHLINHGGPLIIPSGGYLVLGTNNNMASNGGVAVDYAYSRDDLALGNDGDEIILLDGSLNEIDRVEYDYGSSGTFPNPTGATMALSNPALDNNVGGNWFTSFTPYGDGDYGTPGAMNTITPIYDIQHTMDASGDSPYVGQIIATQGVVTAVIGIGNKNVFIQDGIGPWSGLHVYNPDESVNIGDLVEIEGVIIEYYGLTEIEDGNITVLSLGNPIPAAEILPTGSVSQEQWESVLVRVENAHVTNEDMGYGEWIVNDGSGGVYIDDLANYDYVPSNGDLLCYVQGPLYFSYSNFKIEPRNNNDIMLKPVINEFSASTTGLDVEYVEIFGQPDFDYSAFTILEIEGDSGASTGVIDDVIPVDTTDSSGFWLGNLPANALENGTITLLLVEGFTGLYGDDLDTDDDGVLDVTPWNVIIDSVAVHDGGLLDIVYSSVSLGPNYDSFSSYAPGGVSRIPNGCDTDSVSDWVRNDFDLAGISGFAGTPEIGEAYNTPGSQNQAVLSVYNLTVDPLIAVNHIDTMHEINANVGVAIEGIPIVVQVNSNPIVFTSTDENGDIQCSYGTKTAGTDTIDIWIDSDGDGDLDAEEPQVQQIKHWVELESLEPDNNFNPVGTEHSITLRVYPHVANAIINFVVSGANSASGEEITDENGYAIFRYTGTNDGMDTITTYLDQNGDDSWGTYIPLGLDQSPVPEQSLQVTKNWLENFVTGGGNIKNGKKITYSFGGTVGIIEGTGIVGQFQLVDHTGKKAETWHIGTGDFEALTFLGDPTGSPEASHHRAYFSGTFTSNRGDTKFLSLMLFDNDEPGIGNDFIQVFFWDENAEDWESWFGGNINGGNIQVHDIVVE